MIHRRDVLKWGVVAPAMIGAPYAALAALPEGLDAVVLDRRHGAQDLAGFSAAKRHVIDGDVTTLWYDVLDPLWRKPGFVLGGVTGRDALFVLETLAGDRGRRVVRRTDLAGGDGRGVGPVGWVIAPVHPSVRG